MLLSSNNDLDETNILKKRLGAEFGTVPIFSTASEARCEQKVKAARMNLRMSMEHIVNKVWTTISCDWEMSPLTAGSQSAIRKFLERLSQLHEMHMIF
jgi:hypothetical protein